MTNQLASKDAVHGLSCPRCGGMVPTPEGQVIAACPYCDQRSVVVAAGNGAKNAAALPAADNRSPLSELGVRRYQAPLKVGREQAEKEMRSFLGGRVQIARDCGRKAQLKEAFLVHLPFWTVWARGLAYAFGQVKTGSGDNERWEPREKKYTREMVWNVPACEVGEFGVRQVSLDGCPLEPFNPDALHRTGMVFEPVGAETAALEAARASFDETIREEVKMGRTAQVFTRLTRVRLGLVYYPLWVLRYTYRERAFQVVVDGVSGQVLYGKAPGSVGYRAGVLVGGMAAGAVTAIDIPALILGMADTHSHDSGDNSVIGALVVFVVGLMIMWGAYRTFRYGEHYEYHRYGKPKSAGNMLPASLGLNLPGSVRGVASAINTLEKFS